MWVEEGRQAECGQSGQAVAWPYRALQVASSTPLLFPRSALSCSPGFYPERLRLGRPKTLPCDVIRTQERINRVKAVGVSFCGNFTNPGVLEAGTLAWEFRRPVARSWFCSWFIVSPRANPPSPFYASELLHLSSWELHVCLSHLTVAVKLKCSGRK